MPERPQTTDLPEPEDALSGTAARTDDHAPADADDRVVEPVEPDEPTPPVVEDDADLPDDESPV